MILTTFQSVELALDNLSTIEGKLRGPWPLGEVLAHCAQSIEFSLTGFPEPRGWLVRAVIGPLVARRNLRRGFLEHDLDAPIPGAPPPAAFDTADGRARLLAAITRFKAHDGALAPHFAYGALSRADYEKLHAMHVADHLTP